MKKLPFQSLFVILLTSSIVSSCSSGGYEPADYISTTGIAESGQETKIELEDGAAISIPYNSLESQVAVKVERNPEKRQNLPPLDDGFIQISDFYNFEVTSGNLTGPVDLTFPVDSDLIPDKTGVLVMAIPTENGWEYVPVESKDGKVTVFTDQIGDPLVVWHFVEIQPLCDPEIAVQGVQNGDKIEIIGKLLPIRKSMFATQEEPAAGISVSIALNKTFGEVAGHFVAETQDDGSFRFTIEGSQGLKEGWNWVFVNAQCDKPWWGDYVVTSKGYAEFKYSPPVAEQPTSSQAIAPPVVATQEPIPAGAILLPDFVGQPIDNAIEWLKTNGFKYTWVDGSSTYDLGTVYSQAPAGGQYKVPHRTVVVLYRTTEILEDTYGCSNSSLTPEEKANCGTHEYNLYATITYTKGGCWWPGRATTKNEIRTTTIGFKSNGASIDYGGKATLEYAKVENNQYTFDYTDGDEHDYGTLTFNGNGYVIEATAIDPINNCYMHYEYTFR